MNNYEPVLCCLHSMVTFTVTFNFNINYYKYMQVTKNPLKCYFAYKNHNKKIFKENDFLFLHWLEIQTMQVGFALRTNNSMMSAIIYSVPWVIIFLLCTTLLYTYVALSTFTISMVTSAIGFCSCLPSRKIESLWQAQISK